MISINEESQRGSTLDKMQIIFSLSQLLLRWKAANGVVNDQALLIIFRISIPFKYLKIRNRSRVLILLHGVTE